MNLLKAILKSFKITKYRWASVEFKDGSILVGSVTKEVWEAYRERINGR